VPKVRIKIEPVEPIPDSDQPKLIVEFVCHRCGVSCRRKMAKPGFLPRYCADCVPLAAAERVKRWRKRHPEQAKAAAKKQNDKRPRRSQRDSALTQSDVNGASLTSKGKPADE
jgi:hypothetical protein